MLFAHRVSGYVPRAFRYPFEGDVPPHYEASAGVTFFDGVVERHLPGMAQFVILGAGFDTRAFRPPANAHGRSFEVDAPKTQAIKRESLNQAGINVTGVTFIAADFEKEDWLAKLVDAGFDLAKPTLFLWEGVMMYLHKEAVETTLRNIARPPAAASSRSTTSQSSPSRRDSTGAMREPRLRLPGSRSSSASTTRRRRASDWPRCSSLAGSRSSSSAPSGIRQKESAPGAASPPQG
jgi:methyltransferase (TIGR00027 family)